MHFLYVSVACAGTLRAPENVLAYNARRRGIPENGRGIPRNPPESPRNPLQTGAESPRNPLARRSRGSLATPRNPFISAWQAQKEQPQHAAHGGRPAPALARRRRKGLGSSAGVSRRHGRAVALHQTSEAGADSSSTRPAWQAPCALTRSSHSCPVSKTWRRLFVDPAPRPGGPCRLGPLPAVDAVHACCL